MQRRSGGCLHQHRHRFLGGVDALRPLGGGNCLEKEQWASCHQDLEQISLLCPSTQVGRLCWRKPPEVVGTEFVLIFPDEIGWRGEALPDPRLPLGPGLPVAASWAQHFWESRGLHSLSPSTSFTTSQGHGVHAPTGHGALLTLPACHAGCQEPTAHGWEHIL